MSNEQHTDVFAIAQAPATDKTCGCGPDCNCGDDCACGPNGKCAPACTCGDER